NHANHAAHFFQVRFFDNPALDSYDPASGLQKAVEQLEKSGLSCAVGPEDGHPFTGADRKVYIGQRRRGVRVCKAYPRQLYKVHLHGQPFQVTAKLQTSMASKMRPARTPTRISFAGMRPV